jgi:HAD superfamily hydrolase (TIGR01509 family)
MISIIWQKQELNRAGRNDFSAAHFQLFRLILNSMKTDNEQDLSITSTRPVLLFDLDGTLVDSVYQHVLAWREAFEALGVHISNWRIHRRIGMSDALIARELCREAGQSFNADMTEKLRKLHTRFYLELARELRLLPGSRELLLLLKQNSVSYAIATSSSLERAASTLKMLEVGPDIPVITLEQVSFGKPDPDLFFAAMRRLQAAPGRCIVIGDSTWDILAARRAGALAVGLLSGGYPEEELFRAGAFRVYPDPEDLSEHLDELGVHVSPG